MLCKNAWLVYATAHLERREQQVVSNSRDGVRAVRGMPTRTAESKDSR